MHDLPSHHSLANSGEKSINTKFVFIFFVYVGKVHQQWIKIGKDGEVHILNGNAKKAHTYTPQQRSIRTQSQAHAHAHKQTNSQIQRKVKLNNAKGAEKENRQREKWCGVEQPTPNKPPNFGAIQTVSSAIVMINFLPFGMRYAYSHTWIHFVASHTMCLPILRENFNVNAFVYLFVYWLESFCIPHCTLYCMVENTHEYASYSRAHTHTHIKNRYHWWKHTQDAACVRALKSFHNYNVAMFCLQLLWCRKSAKMDGICLFCDFNVSAFLRIH